MKQFWLKKNECTGCASCANVCPKDALVMQSDVCGFAYPHISNSCIDCNACQSVCESRLNQVRDNATCPDTYAAWSTNQDIRFNSTSGGAFTELARRIISLGGYVVGARYNENNNVEHFVVNDNDELDKLRQSKYTQSNIGYVFREIKKLLVLNKIVAFCGAPCQVAGLYAYLGKKYDKLFTFDFICRGVNSPKAYRSWLQEIEEQHGRKITKVWFKYKEGGWKSSPRRTRIDFDDGRYIVLEQDDNLYMTGYLGPNLYIRPSCGNCKFKGIPRQADITLADFWGIDSVLDDDEGTSLILVNNEKGRALFEEAKEGLKYYQRDFEEILKGNVCFGSSVTINPQSEAFLKSLDKRVFSRAIKKYSKVTIRARLKKKVQKVLICKRTIYPIMYFVYILL